MVAANPLHYDSKRAPDLKQVDLTGFVRPPSQPQRENAVSRAEYADRARAVVWLDAGKNRSPEV